MAIAFSNVTSLANASYSPTAVTGSFTSITGQYYLVSCAGGGITGITSTNGITFTSITASGTALYLYGGYCTSGASGTITLTGGGVGDYSVDTISGMATSGCIAQSNNAAAQSTTLSALASGSATFLCGTNALNAITIKSGWTQLVNIGSTSLLMTGYEVAGDNAPNFTGTASGPAIIAVEVKGPPPVAYGTAASVNSVMQLGCGV
jgi:hypothetical protein